MEHTQEDAYEEQVKAKALEKIIQQKAFYEETLGVALTPIGIRDSNVFNNGTRGAMVLNQAVEGFMTVQRERISVYKSEPPPEQSPSFDEIKYEANLSVDFKIEQAEKQ